MDLDSFLVNGKKCIVLPSETDVMDIMSKMDISHPIPIVEIPNLEIVGDTAVIEILFRSTGHDYKMKLLKENNGKFNILKLLESTI